MVDVNFNKETWISYKGSLSLLRKKLVLRDDVVYN